MEGLNKRQKIENYLLHLTSEAKDSIIINLLLYPKQSKFVMGCVEEWDHFYNPEWNKDDVKVD